MYKEYNYAVKTIGSLVPRTAYVLTPSLRSLNIELTNHCNLRCKMCFAGGRPQGFMSLELFKKIIDEIRPSVSVGMTFAGEALIHPNFGEMLRIAYSKAKKVLLTTNGMLLGEHVDPVCAFTNDLAISLDGVGAVNDAIRIGSKFSVIERNIAEVMKRPKRPKVYVCLTISTQTQEQIKEFVDYWTGKVDMVRIKPMFTDELIVLDESFYNGRKIQRVCDFPFHFMGIFWNGDVTTCCADLNGINTYDSIKEKSIYEVWNGKSMKDIRYRLLTRRPTKICSTCTAWKYY